MIQKPDISLAFSKIIKLLGYSNGNTDYKKAKRAIEKWQTVESLNEEQIKECLKRGQWTGAVISDGYIVVDIDSRERGKIIYEGLLKAGYSFIAIETPNGYQFIFKDTGRIKNQRAKWLTLGGIVVDYRLPGKGYIVLPSINTKDRKVRHNPEKDLDTMPLFFLPVRGIKETDTELGTIPEGMRDTTLISHASRLREWNIAHNLNLTLEEKRLVLSEINQILCYPPLEQKDIDKILQSAESYQAISTPRRGTNVTNEPLITELERIERVTIKNYSELLPEIASLESEIEKEILCKALSKKIDVNYRTVRNAIKTFERDKGPAIKDSNIIIAHPSYYINHDFMSLGFRETVVIDSRPEDKNFYVISNQDGIHLYENRVLQHGNQAIIFDERDRLLVRHEDRWHKDRILSFIKNPETPEGLYHEIKTVLKQYIELPKDATYGLLSSWIIATYFFLIFYAFPFLFIYGKKQSGKSRLLTLLERLAFNAMKIKGVSVASLADSIDGIRGIFLNDQAESLSDTKNIEILGIIADSYTRGGGNRRIVDMSNKKRRVLEFETYSPKAFASTKEIDPDIEDRCIEITMIRAIKDYPEPEAFLPVWQDLRDKLYRLLLTKWQDVKAIYQDTGEGVSQRVRELWRPIETILRLQNVSGDEMKAIREFFLESMMITQSELTDNEHEFFEVLLELLEDKGEDTLTAKEIAEKLKHDEGMSEKGLQTWIGRTIRQFSLYDYQAGRKGKSRAYKFTYNHVKDVFNRYTIRSGGFSGNVVQTLDNQQSIIDHFKNIGGNEVVNTTCLDNNTTCEPPIKSEVVASKTLKNKDLNHLTTLTTCPVEEVIIEGEL